MLALSLDNARSQFVKIKWLHFKTKSPPTSSPGPSQLSVSTGQWVVWRSFYHGCPALVTDGPLQRSSQTYPVCYHTQAHRWAPEIVQMCLDFVFCFVLFSPSLSLTHTKTHKDTLARLVAELRGWQCWPAGVKFQLVFLFLLCNSKCW